MASNSVKIPIKSNKLVNNEILAINPKIQYLNIIKNMTNNDPIIKAKIPDLIESSPSPGPTVLSSIISNGAGKAPDLKSNAKSVAD